MSKRTECTETIARSIESSSGCGSGSRPMPSFTTVPGSPRMRLIASSSGSLRSSCPSIARIASPGRMPARAAGESSSGAMTVSTPSSAVTSTPMPE